MKTCTNCYYYSAPLHQGDLSCAVNPGGKAEQCSAYEYEDHAAEIRHTAIKCIKAACIYSQLRDLQKRTSIEDNTTQEVCQGLSGNFLEGASSNCDELLRTLPEIHLTFIIESSLIFFQKPFGKF